MLIVFAGLPGIGKSTIAALLARRLRGAYLRIDTIEQALRSCGTLPAGVATEGYAVAYRIAEDCLRASTPVIADSVNPLPATRDAWLAVAKRAAAPVLEVEIVCSDPREHRRRIETRSSNVSGLKLPTWDDVLGRDYRPWDRPHMVLDTVGRTVETVVAELLSIPSLRGLADRGAATNVR